MTDDRFDADAADERALSAYLAGELDDDQVAVFEQRLAREPDLVQGLDALADALAALAGAEAAEPPAGFEQRLGQRLITERRAMPTDLAGYRRRRDRSRVWLGVGTAAAVVALAALTAGPLLRTVGQGGGATSAEMAEGSSEAAGSAELSAGADTAGQADSGPDAPVILDRNVAIADEQALQRRYEGLPEAEGLLGTSLDAANELAVRFSRAVSERKQVELSSAPLNAGAGGGSAAASAPVDDAAEAGKADGDGDEEAVEAPAAAQPEAGTAQQDFDAVRDRRAAAATDPCLATITSSTDTVLLPVRVETVRYDGKRALAYVFVTASPGSATLDRTEVWVVRPRDCATFVFQQY